MINDHTDAGEERVMEREGRREGGGEETAFSGAIVPVYAARENA